jgi:hypothetical protein
MPKLRTQSARAVLSGEALTRKVPEPAQAQRKADRVKIKASDPHW